MICAVVATGYGRKLVSIADATITEVTCQAWGVRHRVPEARTIIDIGGQDSKLVRPKADGTVGDFVMNGRCAAGTGRFLEVLATRLAVKLTSLGSLVSLAPHRRNCQDRQCVQGFRRSRVGRSPTVVFRVCGGLRCDCPTLRPGKRRPVAARQDRPAMKDMEKRKRVMQRSMQLGHCICDPKKPCPCDILRQHDICPCAGERLEVAAGPVRLTELVESAGCASKIDRATLTKVLEGLPSLNDPRVLVGMPAGDDAGVYQLDAQTALVQTVDVFSPSVDDPYVFGQVAAASKADVEIIFDDIPLLPGVLECAAQGILPGAIERNKESSGHALAASDGVPPAMLDILFDAQTSGGLLIAVPEPSADPLVAQLRGDGITEAAVVGRVLAVGTGRVFVRGRESDTHSESAISFQRSAISSQQSALSATWMRRAEG